MSMKIKKLGLALLLVIGIVFFKQSWVEAGELNFSVAPVFPENQINKSKPYFDLRVTPGQKQTIEVTLENKAEKDITVNIYPTSAKTNRNGIIDNKDMKSPNDQSLKYPFNEIAHVDEAVTLGPKEKKNVPITIDVPAEPFDGMIMGALYLKEEEYKDENQAEEDKGGMQIRNVFSYLISVILTESDTSGLKPDLKILEAKASTANAHNVFDVILQNPEPINMSKLHIIGKIYKKGSATPLYQQENDDFKMAPNSNFPYGISLNGDAFKPGDYTAEIIANTDKQEWKLKKDFKVTDEQASKLNADSIEKLDYGPNYWLWGGIAAAVLLVLVIVFVVLYRLKAKKAQKEIEELKKAAKKKVGRKEAKKVSSKNRKGAK